MFREILGHETLCPATWDIVGFNGRPEKSKYLPWRSSSFSSLDLFKAFDQKKY